MNEDLAFIAGDNDPPSKNFKIKSLAQMERDYIEMVIAYCKGNILQAADLLEVSPSTLYRKRERWTQGQ